MPDASEDLKCATCGCPSAALDLAHGDGVCGICGAAATNAAPTAAVPA